MTELTITTAYSLDIIYIMKLTTAVASIALVGVAHAVDVPQSEDKLINYVNYIEECELTCWKKSTKAMGCEMTDFNCFCKNAGSNYIGQATMCAFDACDNAFGKLNGSL